MNFKNKGFTLIELLVAVLIIGILAAIALPQYQLAVDKTIFAKFNLTVKNIDDAYQRYYVITGNYPRSFDDLDMDLPGYNSITNPSNRVICAIYDSYTCCIHNPIAHQYYGIISCHKSDNSLKFYKRIFDDAARPTTIYFCLAKNDNKRANRLCKNLNYYKKDVDGDYNRYTLH